MTHAEIRTLESGLDVVRAAPKDAATIQLIVRRPAVGERELLDAGEFDIDVGLVGDSWQVRGSGRTGDGSAHPGMQVTLVNSRAAALIAGAREHWALSGDQLFADLDVSAANLPPGTRLEVGAAMIQISDQPHTGCAKYAARYGRDAMRFVNSDIGRALNLRGINARVVTGGQVRVGDPIRKLSSGESR